MIGSVGPALVLKLGGRLAGNGRLMGVVDLVARSSVPVVVVPGGGPFADAVRAAQPQLKLTDGLAHRLALLAMHQMGLVIASRHPRLALCETLDDLAAALVRGAVPVWLPFALQHDDANVPADWTVTSDALAARLAERMGGASVALVKSCPIANDITLVEAKAAGIVDPVFGVVVTRARLRWTLYGAGDETRLADRLCQG
jgi:5-(aminomethyl)-3-furanmethanol phosphate kinase